MGLQFLRNHLSNFLDNETETYHSQLKNKLNSNPVCTVECDFKKGQQRKPGSKVPNVCKDCEPWRDAIWANTTAQNLLLYWDNCKPHLWPTQKWEVAKVYMPRGNGSHKCLEDFDISAVLNYMKQCKHFQTFVKPKDLTEVLTVRNKVMHSVDFQVRKDDLDGHLEKIRKLGKNMKLWALVEELDQLQNADFRFMLQLMPGVIHEQIEGGNLHNIQEIQKYLNLEHQILKEKLESLAQRYEEDEEIGLKKEELLGMKNFLDQNKDLLQQLGPQLDELKEVQERVDKQGEQIDNLTGRVDQLEKATPDPGFSTDVLKYKNHLIEEARKNHWSPPVFTEIQESTGYRGCVRVNGQTFQGRAVCGKLKQAHQEVAKIALEQLMTPAAGPEDVSVDIDIDQSNTNPSNIHQSNSVSGSGSQFFCSVKVFLNNDITNEEGHDGTHEAMEAAFRKLACLFDLEVSRQGSHKAMVLEHFEKCGFRPPEEFLEIGLDKKTRCTLRLSGPFTFHNTGGSSKKKLAEQQAARVALLQLSRILEWEVGDGGNCKGLLQERLVAQGLKPPEYKHTGGVEGGLQVQSAESHVINTDFVDTKEPFLVEPPTFPASATLTEPKLGGASSLVSISAEERSASSESWQFFATVTVTVKREFEPTESSTKEGALQAAYKSLMEALSLKPASAPSVGFARECVQDFLKAADGSPPLEDCDTADGGRHRCRLRLCGTLTFRNQERAPKKQQAVQWAAKEALLRLAGVLGWDPTVPDGNYKGRLQELLAKQGEAQPVYKHLQWSSPGSAPTPGDSSARIGPHALGTGLPGSAPTPGDRSARIGPHAPGTGLPGSAPTPGDRSARGGPPQAGADTPLKRPGGLDTSPLSAKMASMQPSEIQKMLMTSGLGPPLVTCGNISQEQRFECQVDVQLENFMFKNQRSYSNKKEALRKTYLIFGLACGICPPDTDESQCTQVLKTYFSQKSFPLPEEVFDREDKKFKVSLEKISCVFSYIGEGLSEDLAKLEASWKALSSLASLSCYDALARPASAPEAEARLTSLLATIHQDPPAFRPADTQHRASVDITLTDYTLEAGGQSSRTESRNQLSVHILRLVADTDSRRGVSLRNQMDDWFKKRGFTQPVFKDTGTVGAEVTFSVTFTCSCPDWQASWEGAERRLVEEVQGRFRHLRIPTGPKL